MAERAPAPRGRHAPPPEVRLPLERQRLLRAAAVEFARRGYDRFRAGPQMFADALDAENAPAARRGLIKRFASPYDAYAVGGAITELVSRQLRLGDPADVLELAPVIDRLIIGVLAQQ
jgi:hypothetical protein